MKLVYICSKLRGDIEHNIQKAHEYCRMAVELGVIPIAPHTIYTKYLDDREPDQRERGLQMGLELLLRCGELWYFDKEISEGMAAEINLAKQNGIPIFQIIDPDNPICYPSCPQDLAEIMTLHA